MIAKPYIVPLLAILLTVLFVVWAAVIQLPAPNLGEISVAPSHVHLLGTSPEGRDLLRLSMVLTIRAAAESLWAASLTIALGIVVGITSASFAGSLFDHGQQELAKLFDSIGAFLFAVCLSAMAPQVTTWRLSVLLAFVAWPSVSNVVRAETIRAVQLTYIDAARAMGIGQFRLALNHLLPEMLDRIGPLSFGVYIGFVALFGAIDFIGVRISSDQSLGFAIFESTLFLRSTRWYFITCFSAFVILVIGSAVVGRTFRLLHVQLSKVS